MSFCLCTSFTPVCNLLISPLRLHTCLSSVHSSQHTYPGSSATHHQIGVSSTVVVMLPGHSVSLWWFILIIPCIFCQSGSSLTCLSSCLSACQQQPSIKASPVSHTSPHSPSHSRPSTLVQHPSSPLLLDPNAAVTPASRSSFTREEVLSASSCLCPAFCNFPHLLEIFFSWVVTSHVNC